MELELRTCVLLKINDLRDYEGQVLSRSMIEAEAQKNELEGRSKRAFVNEIYEKY